MPFMDEKLQMRDVYVPLTAMAADGTAGAQDVARPLDDQLRTVVTGGPGAGKSMLLRHAMLTWATSGVPRVDHTGSVRAAPAQRHRSVP